MVKTWIDVEESQNVNLYRSSQGFALFANTGSNNTMIYTNAETTTIDLPY